MRVFAVAHVVRLLEGKRQRAWELRIAVLRGEVCGDCAVVRCRLRERLRGEPRTKRTVRTVAAANRLEHLVIITRFGHDRDARLVLGCATHHRRAADVDVLDGLFMRGAARDGLLKRVEVHAHQVDRLSANPAQRVAIAVAIAHEDSAVDAWVKGLDATVHDLGRLGVLRDVDDGDSALAERLGRAAGGQNLHSRFRESLRELDDTRLVRDRYQCAFDLCHAPTLWKGPAIPRGPRGVNRF